MNDTSDIPKYSCALSEKNFFRKTFVQYVTAWLVRLWTYKNAEKKNKLFDGEENTYKHRQKRTKNEYCVNPPKPDVLLRIPRPWTRIEPGFHNQQI